MIPVFTLSAALFEYSMAVWLLACTHALGTHGANMPKSSAQILQFPSSDLEDSDVA